MVYEFALSVPASMIRTPSHCNIFPIRLQLLRYVLAALESFMAIEVAGDRRLPARRQAVVIKPIGNASADIVPEPLAREEVERVLALLLASPLFAKSRRMGSLLRFLVEHDLQFPDIPLTEHAIGIAVFRRDPAVYCTGDDPVVRVQVGRLRRKLASHYATFGQQDPVRLSLPAGCYRLAYQRLRLKGIAIRHPVLQLQPFTCITRDGDDFTRGLCEELSCRLFESFEQTQTRVSHVLMKVPRSSVKTLAQGRTGRGSYSLEGSVRVEPARVRASVRLIDVAQGRIRWSEQFDRNRPYGIATQEDLAESICQSLTGYFARGDGDD
jgi:TolB-like protein